MSTLFSNLTFAAGALDAQRTGLDVVGQNIANANTPGYARRVVDLAPVGPDSPGGAGRGVDVTDIRALRDRLLERRLQQEVPAGQRDAAMASALSVVESSLGSGGATIDASLDRLFNAFADLAASPASASTRQSVQLQAESLASAFRDMAGRFEDARHNADSQIRSTADDINGLTARIVELNRAISASPSAEASLGLEDEQNQLVRSLAELTDITVLDRSNGGVDISTGNGAALVVGETAYEMTTASQPPSGYCALRVSGQDVTASITSGKLGGLLAVRDVNIPGYQDQLDTLAYTLADQVNTLHASGYDQTGAAGGEFFSFSTTLTGTSGAAAALVVASDVASDTRKIAAAGTTDAGDNQVARSLAALRDSRVLDGGTGTLADGWAALVYSVGRHTKDADDAKTSREAVVNQIDALRDQVSGVSLDEEAMSLLKFQRAYEANAKFFQAIDQAIQTLLQTMS